MIHLRAHRYLICDLFPEEPKVHAAHKDGDGVAKLHETHPHEQIASIVRVPQEGLSARLALNKLCKQLRLPELAESSESSGDEAPLSWRIAQRRDKRAKRAACRNFIDDSQESD